MKNVIDEKVLGDIRRHLFRKGGQSWQSIRTQRQTLWRVTRLDLILIHFGDRASKCVEYIDPKQNIGAVRPNGWFACKQEVLGNKSQVREPQLRIELYVPKLLHDAIDVYIVARGTGIC